MMKTNYLKIGMWMSLPLLLTFSACEKLINDIKETTTSAEDAVISESALASAFEVIEDIASTDNRLKKNGNPLLPDGAQLIFTDSSFTDGTPVRFYVDFGPMDLNDTINAKGLLCADGKYRAGRIEVEVNKPYTEIGCVINAVFPTSNSYFIGDGWQMNRVTGTLTATRTAVDEINLVIANAIVESKQGSLSFNSEKTIRHIKGQDIPGVIGDEFEISGKGNGKNRNGEDYITTITLPLIKRVEDGCANTFIIGRMELENLSSKRILKIDYDPFNNGVCDKIVRITLPGGVEKDIEVN